MELPEDDEKSLVQLQQDVLTPQEQRLLPREHNAYRAWRHLGQPKLSPDTQARFFALFLKGESLEDIVRLNRGFSLGQLAEACIEGDWYVKRDEYLESLLSNVRSIVQQTSLESIRFVTDQLAAVHKKYGEAARRYLQTGDEKELKDFGIDDIKTYKTAIEALQKLTGQDQKVQHQHDHHHTVAPVAPVHRPLKSEEAAVIIRARRGRK